MNGSPRVLVAGVGNVFFGDDGFGEAPLGHAGGERCAWRDGRTGFAQNAVEKMDESEAEPRGEFGPRARRHLPDGLEAGATQAMEDRRIGTQA